MTISPARLAANRLNAARSTGPRTLEGKAISRFNAIRHGMAGSGDLINPCDQAQLVIERQAEWAANLEVATAVERALVHRAALLSVRAEIMAERDLATIAVRVETARSQFEAERLDPVDAIIADLEADRGDSSVHLSQLATSPEGVEYLISAWQDLQAEVSRENIPARRRAQTWLGVEPGNDLKGNLNAMIDAEVTRLRALAAALLPELDQIEAARTRADLGARFDSGPDATLAYRYEAAAERGMFRALRELADLREADFGAVKESQPAKQTPQVPPTPTLGSGPIPPVGSFRTEALPVQTPDLPFTIGRQSAPSHPAPPSKKRRDVRQPARRRR